MDADGYPDEIELQRIKEWPATDLLGLMAFVENLWWMPDWGWRKKGNIYSISTAGWSGNESLVKAMHENWMFWTFCWQSSRRGGHYEFEVKPYA